MPFGSNNWQVSEDQEGPGTGYEEPASMGDMAGAAKEKGEEWWTKSGMWAPGTAAELLRSDVEALEGGDLGKSEAEIQQHAGKSATQAGALLGAQQTDLNRERLGSGGGFGGQFSEMVQQLGGKAAEAGAQARAKAIEWSEQLAEARRAEILGRLERQQDRSKEDIQAAREAISGAFTGIFDAVMSAQGAGSVAPAL